MKGKWKFVYLNPIVWFLVIWLLSLGKCELLTLVHGNQFSNREQYESSAMIGKIDYIKVLDYSKHYARIYCVGNNNSAAWTLQFVKKNFDWEYVGWADLIWSTTGSADDTLFPYWWHFFYSHPQLSD